MHHVFVNKKVVEKVSMHYVFVKKRNLKGAISIHQVCPQQSI